MLTDFNKENKLIVLNCVLRINLISICPFNLRSVCLQNSLTRSAPLNSEAQGRSGARFHTSYDKRYVIKTISSEDVAEMHNILKKYHQVIIATSYSNVYKNLCLNHQRDHFGQTSF